MANKQQKRKRRLEKNIPVEKKSQITSPSNKRLWIYYAILIIILFSVFGPFLNNEFLNFDDNVLITENPVIANDGDFDLKKIFRSKLFSPHYKPVTFLSWNLEYRMFGFDPFVFHLNNLLLHILNTLLVFGISRKLLSRIKLDKQYLLLIPFFIALLFAIHPMKVESVVWATERKDVLFSFFFLLSSWFYISYTTVKKSMLFLILSVLFYFLSMLSKSMGITLIAVYFLYDLLLGRKWRINIFYEKGLHFLVFVIAFYLYGLFTDFGTHASGLSVGVVNQGFDYYPSNFDGLSSIYVRILIINIRLILWILHFVFPVSLSAIYPKFEILETLGPAIHLFPILTLVLLYFSLRLLKRSSWISFGLLFFLITLSPAIAIADKGVGIFLSDRYTYIASVGMLIILVVLLSKIASRYNSKLLFYLPLITLSFIYTYASVSYAGHWKNSEVFWTRVLSVTKKESSAFNGRGRYYSSKGMLNKAFSDFSNAIKFDPANHLGYANRGKLYFDRKEYDKAIKDLSRSIEIKDNQFEVWSNRGAAYGMLGDYENSLIDVNKALEIKPDHANSLKSRAIIWMQKENFDAAIIDFKKHQELSAIDADIVNAIGVCYLNLENYNEAINYFSDAISANPKRGIFYGNRANSYLRINAIELARKDARSAVELGARLNTELIKLLE